MRMLMGKTATLLAVLSLLVCSDVSAIEATPPPIDYYSPIYITAFQTSRLTTSVDGVDVPTDSLDLIEFHNDTDDPLDLSGWSVSASDEFGLLCTISLSSWILPDDFVVMKRATLALDDSTGNIREFSECAQPERVISKLTLESDTTKQDEIAPTTVGAFARKSLTKTYRSGTFTKDFVAMNESSRTALYAGVWYDPLPLTQVRLVEIMARSRQCSPLEVAPDCSDFIKLHNPTTSNMQLDGLRLRIGYQGQSSSSSNTHILSGSIPAGRYAVLEKKSDGSPISITNDGGYGWLEDSYGIQRYDDTVVDYPSASSVTKIGWSWAQDFTDGAWRWTSSPQPYDSPNVFTLPVEPATIAAAETLTPCASNQYRNPLTNRCKLIATTASSVQACAANQYRNPLTNRCKSLSSSTSSSLQPCRVDQYRNPATNRCKAIASTASTLKPCTENQERNPETNRCRNKTIVSSADFPVEAVAQGAEATVGWWAFGGVGILAAGYAGWEWRKEATGALIKVASFFTSGK